MLFVLALLLLVGCSDQQWRTTDISEIMPALDFDLVNEDGVEVDETLYEDKATLLYFGYTHCPDICPITLAKMASAIRQLDTDAREHIQVLFISVDPRRDTIDVLRQYTDAFGPEFVGLTGSNADIDAVANRYRVTYGYGDEDASGNYNVTHTSAVFAFDQQGQAAFMIREGDTLKSIVADLNRLISL
ncbi:SCO family protein [Halomonas sp. SpR8]|uniref:SCO family protein n=1 Tax=Halomonas sp. SpR8 TaxID=3050463 RepID=UPI0027E3D6D7|nr:SCO family protein [Halomonas sp. SpR8]MDQ7729520.1 SCO family protein [Halomonas sp. SpR8]